LNLINGIIDANDELKEKNIIMDGNAFAKAIGGLVMDPQTN